MEARRKSGGGSFDASAAMGNAKRMHARLHRRHDSECHMSVYVPHMAYAQEIVELRR